MHKIYSRKRLIIGNSQKKFAFLLTVITIVAFTVVFRVYEGITPIYNKLCEDKAKSIATMISNEQASNVMKEHSYDEMFFIEKDVNENVSMVKSNIIEINEITSDIALKIQNQLDKKERDNIFIPLGSFTGIRLISGKGPKVNLTISSTGVVETKLRSEFSSAGINQTLHRIYLNVKCEVGILTPYKVDSYTITNEVLLLENVIIGIVPSTYYNLEGLNESDLLDTF